jgi:histidinol-phosphate aminotransferase
MNKYIPERLNALFDYPAELSYPKIKLDANESPFDLSDDVFCDFIESLSDVSFKRYPDPRASAAVNAFAKRHGLDADNVVAGVGSDELISVIINSFLDEKSTIVTAPPDFSMYNFYGGIRGAKVVDILKGEDFAIDFDSLAKASKKADLIIFSNPCNPTGRSYSRENILSFVDSCDCLVIIDEAYAEFSDIDISVINEAGNRENLIILRTLSKAYGLAAIRCGFAVSNSEVAAAIRKVKSPYNLNSVTEEFAACVLSAEGHDKNIENIKANRKKLEDELFVLGVKYNFKVYKSDANFVLIEFDEDRAMLIHSMLKEKGVSTRLLAPYLRITAGKDDEIAIFLEIFERITKNIMPENKM